MRLLVSAGLFSLIFLFPVHSRSHQLTSNFPNIESTKGFLEICATVDEKPGSQSPFELFKSGYCVGWMDGFTTGIFGAEAAHRVSEKDAIFCLPKGNSFQQMVHITRKYIAEHPEKEHLATAAIVLAALREAYPCRYQPK